MLMHKTIQLNKQYNLGNLWQVQEFGQRIIEKNLLSEAEGGGGRNLVLKDGSSNFLFLETLFSLFTQLKGMGQSFSLVQNSVTHEILKQINYITIVNYASLPSELSKMILKLDSIHRTNDKEMIENVVSSLERELKKNGFPR